MGQRKRVPTGRKRRGKSGHLEAPGGLTESGNLQPDKGGPVKDPILQASSLGADKEPGLDELLKGDAFSDIDGTIGKPGPGRTSKEDIRSRGPLAWLEVLGPGLITGASDDDPSGIGTYSQVGSQFGFGMLWLPLFTLPLMAAVQELCARIALHTGVGLGIALRRKFPSWLVGAAIAALFVANTLNAGADIGAVATGGSMLTHSRISEIVLVIPVGLLIVGLQLFVSYQRIFLIFKWLTLALFAYVITGLIAHPDAITVLKATLIPHFELSKPFIVGLVAVLGTTISPYLFFWQASAEVDAMRSAGLTTEASRRGVKRSEMQAARADILVGMIFSNLVAFFIILVTAAVLHAHGKTGVQSAAQAATALAPFLGSFSTIVFAVGLIGTGLLAIPILTASAAYAVKEFFGLGGALAIKPIYRPTFYAIMVISVGVGTAMNFLGIDPIRALFYVAVINGLVAPPLLFLIALLGSDKSVMKDKTSGPFSLVLVWVAAGVMTLAALTLLTTLIPGLRL